MRVSGPVLIYDIEYEGSKILLMGSLHDSTSGLCSKECKSCFDPVNLMLSLINQPVNFYLEAPYIPRWGIYNAPRALIKEADEKGEIHAIHGYLLPLFIQGDKFRCVDTRIQYHHESIDKELKFVEEAPIINLLFEYPLVDLINEWGESLVVQNFIYTLYGEGLIYRLFDLIFTSDNLVQDTAKLLQPYLDNLPPSNFNLSMKYPGVTVEKRHVVRHQLLQLPPGTSEYIVNYIRNEYCQHQAKDNLWLKMEAKKEITPNVGAESVIVDAYILALLFSNLPNLQIAFTGFLHSTALAKFFSNLGAEVKQSPKDFDTHYALHHIHDTSRCTRIP